MSQATESPVHVDAIPSRSVVSRVPDVADTRRRVVLLGGSFDPVHAGHLAMAHAALDQLEADEVWFIPARQAPLKSRQLTPGEHRKAMLEIALKNEPQMRVETCELEREGESFTIDTVRYLKKQYPDCDFTFLVGNDQVEQFHKWKEADALARLGKIAA
uniref:nicotinate (nicotinamide) nucleotide adenylyltransferase n=1 Tax=Faecalibaculum rodentium TaxID=1702221 RepID=UPI002570C1F1